MELVLCEEFCTWEAEMKIYDWIGHGDFKDPVTWLLLELKLWEDTIHSFVKL
jgi:hypothetical protein